MFNISWLFAHCNSILESKDTKMFKGTVGPILAQQFAKIIKQVFYY